MEQSAGLRGADRTRHCLVVKPRRISPSPDLKQHHPALFCSFQPRDGDAQRRFSYLPRKLAKSTSHGACA